MEHKTIIQRIYCFIETLKYAFPQDHFMFECRFYSVVKNILHTCFKTVLNTEYTKTIIYFRNWLASLSSLQLLLESYLSNDCYAMFVIVHKLTIIKKSNINNLTIPLDAKEFAKLRHRSYSVVHTYIHCSQQLPINFANTCPASVSQMSSFL